jgi:hypothetical protein
LDTPNGENVGMLLMLRSLDITHTTRRFTPALPHAALNCDHSTSDCSGSPLDDLATNHATADRWTPRTTRTLGVLLMLTAAVRSLPITRTTDRLTPRYLTQP